MSDFDIRNELMENVVFDSIKDSGDSPTNSDMKGMDDQDVMNIMVHCDEHTDNDSDFFEAFTKGIFEHFGWTYLHKEDKQGVLGKIKSFVKKDWDGKRG